MSQLKIRALAYQELAHPLLDPRADVATTFETIAERVAPAMNFAVQTVPENEREQIAEHFLCSTIVNTCFTVGDIDWATVRRSFESRVSAAPETFINAYECASWGYALRYYFKQNPEARYVLVSVLDANIYNFEFWVWNHNWEHSGFGCTTVLLERTGELTNELVTGAAMGGNPMMEFATALRRVIGARKHCTLALPFFPENIRLMFDNILKAFERLPNDHPRWGHAFGNDPWIAIMLDALKKGDGHTGTYLGASLALNGYYCMTEVDVTPETRLLLNELPAAERAAVPQKKAANENVIVLATGGAG